MTTSAFAKPAESRVFRYVFPFALFMLVSALEKRIPSAYPAIYTLKVLSVAAAWWWFRRAYPPFSLKGWKAGLLVGAVGALAWIPLSQLTVEGILGDLLPSWMYGGGRVAFNPFRQIANPMGQILFLSVRLFGLAVVVPLMEEVFWRGFLARYLIVEDFEQVPIGRFTPFSFIVVTLLFTVVHPEVIAACVWCAAVNLLLISTRNLWSCILAHAVTNLLLGIYVIATGSWQLW